MPYPLNSKSYGNSSNSGGYSSPYSSSGGGSSSGGFNSLLLGRYDYSGGGGGGFPGRSPLFGGGISYGGSFGGFGGFGSPYGSSSSGGSSSYGSGGHYHSPYSRPSSFGSLATISEHSTHPSSSSSSSSNQRRLPRGYVPSLFPASASPSNYTPSPSAYKKPAVFNTENIDVTTPRNVNKTATPGEITREKPFGTIKRGRTVIRMVTNKQKDNPYLTEEEQKERAAERKKEKDREQLTQRLRDELKDELDWKKPNKKAAGDKFREKFMIQSKKKKYSGYRRPTLSDIRIEKDLLQKELESRLNDTEAIVDNDIDPDETERLEKVKERLAHLDKKIARRFSKALRKANSSATDDESSEGDENNPNNDAENKVERKSTVKLKKSSSRNTIKASPFNDPDEILKISPMLTRKATKKFFFPAEGASAVQPELVEAIVLPEPDDQYEQHILANRATLRRASHHNVNYIRPRKSSITSELLDLVNTTDEEIIPKKIVEEEKDVLQGIGLNKQEQLKSDKNNSNFPAPLVSPAILGSGNTLTTAIAENKSKEELVKPTNKKKQKIPYGKQPKNKPNGLLPLNGITQDIQQTCSSPLKLATEDVTKSINNKIQEKPIITEKDVIKQPIVQKDALKQPTIQKDDTKPKDPVEIQNANKSNNTQINLTENDATKPIVVQDQVETQKNAATVSKNEEPLKEPVKQVEEIKEPVPVLKVKNVITKNKPMLSGDNRSTSLDEKVIPKLDACGKSTSLDSTVVGEEKDKEAKKQVKEEENTQKPVINDKPKVWQRVKKVPISEDKSIINDDAKSKLSNSQDKTLKSEPTTPKVTPFNSAPNSPKLTSSSSAPTSPKTKKIVVDDSTTNLITPKEEENSPVVIEKSKSPTPWRKPKIEKTITVADKLGLKNATPPLSPKSKDNKLLANTIKPEVKQFTFDKTEEIVHKPIIELIAASKKDSPATEVKVTEKIENVTKVTETPKLESSKIEPSQNLATENIIASPTPKPFQNIKVDIKEKTQSDNAQAGTPKSPAAPYAFGVNAKAFQAVKSKTTLEDITKSTNTQINKNEEKPSTNNLTPSTEIKDAIKSSQDKNVDKDDSKPLVNETPPKDTTIVDKPPTKTELKLPEAEISSPIIQTPITLEKQEERKVKTEVKVAETILITDSEKPGPSNKVTAKPKDFLTDKPVSPTPTEVSNEINVETNKSPEKTKKSSSKEKVVGVEEKKSLKKAKSVETIEKPVVKVQPVVKLPRGKKIRKTSAKEVIEVAPKSPPLEIKDNEKGQSSNLVIKGEVVVADEIINTKEGQVGSCTSDNQKNLSSSCEDNDETLPSSKEKLPKQKPSHQRLQRLQRAKAESKSSSSSSSSSGSGGGSSSSSSSSTAKSDSTSASTSSTLTGSSAGSSRRRMPSPPLDDDDDDEESISLDKICPAKNRPKYRKYEVEDFQFLKVLGKGSFGKVLLAELKDTDSYFAIKCLKKDVVLEDDDVECTMIERKVLLMGSKHPYLCHLFCTFQTESHLFFVMEYLNGGDLMFHIQQSGKFSEERGRFYGAEIVSGLKFLHKKGVMYRDLKLDNILLDYEGHIRIADFGMCKLQIYLDRTADTFCGTPDYMAPEIIKGLRYNQCVDWWAFGVLLYEMLVGQSPFSGSDEDELFWSICNEPVHFPRFLSKEAKWILERLLEKDASRRLGMASCAYGDVKQQLFFNSIDWDKLELRELEPPFRPKLKHPLDVQYFDTTFTKELARLTPVDKEILQSMDQSQFEGFSYTNPHTTD